MKASSVVLVAASALLWSAGLRAQVTVQLRGVVIDSLSGQPVAEAIVRVPSLRKYTLTNAQGLFQLQDVPRGTLSVVIVQLGYGEKTVLLNAEPDGFHTLAIAPRPIELAPIDVSSGFMKQMATRRAMDLTLAASEPVFWKSWDRDDIATSGAAEPLSFLRAKAKLVISRCAGLGMPTDRLCVAVPFAGAPYPASYAGVFNWRPRTIGESRPGSRFRATTRYGRIYLDDRPFGRMEGLERLAMDDIVRVETFGYRGEQMIRLYTTGYMRLVEAGIIRPDLSVPPDIFETSRRRFDPPPETPSVS